MMVYGAWLALALLLAVPVAADLPDGSGDQGAEAAVDAPGTAAGIELDDGDDEILRLMPRDMAGLKADVAALILGGREGGSLRAIAMAAPFPIVTEGKSRVDVWVEIEGASLLGESAPEPAETTEGETTEGESGADDGAEGESMANEPAAPADRPESLRVELHAYAMTSKGALVGSVGQWVRVPVNEMGDDLLGGGLKFAVHLELEPGDYDLRVLVRETRTQRFSLRILPLKVLSPTGSKPYLLPPIFDGIDRAWIHADGSEPSAAFTASRAPAALPVLSGDARTVRFLGRGLAPDKMTARLLDAEKQVVAELELDPVAPAVPVPDMEALEARLDLSEVATGNYLFEASIGGGAATTSMLPIYVLGPDWDEETLAWTEIQRLNVDPNRRRAALERAEERRAAKRIVAVAQGYRQVLDRLSTGAIDLAVDELREMELSFSEATKNANEVRRWLSGGETRVIEKLAKRDPECLVPLLLLHINAHAHYFKGVVQPILAMESRERIMTLAQFYADEAKNELAPTLAAVALADLGVTLSQARLRVAARHMLEKALDLDKTNTVALVHLAQDHERRAEYKEATNYLERLLQVEPRSDEGRLRLALNLRRLGKPSRAARLLRQVIDDNGPDWLLAVAYDELARIYLDTDRADQAVTLLEAGIARLPREQRLYVHLAYALDRNGLKRRGHEILDRMPERGAGKPTPRNLYSRRSREAGDPTHAALVRNTMARLPVLMGVLGSMEGGS